MRIIVVAVVFVAAVLSAAAQAGACDAQIAGDIPEVLHPALCEMATFAHGGGPPANGLSILASERIVGAMRLGTPGAETLMLTLLDAWMRLRGVETAQIDVRYELEPLARASKTPNEPPSVEFYWLTR